MPAIIYRKKNSMGYITINRPEVMNAFNSEAKSGLTEALIQARDDEEVRVVILTGAGDKAFSVGADLKDSKGTPDNIQLDYFDLFPSLGILTPIIAAINGYCLGNGLFLALACDIRIASENAVFGIPEASLGRFPNGGVTQWLPRLIPAGIALKLLLTGERFSASDAYRFGLITEVVHKDNLINAAERIAEQISNNGPLAVRGAKRAVWMGLRHGINEKLLMAPELLQIEQSQDRKEGTQAFKEKRRAMFKGK